MNLKFIGVWDSIPFFWSIWLDQKYIFINILSKINATIVIEGLLDAYYYPNRYEIKQIKNFETFWGLGPNPLFWGKQHNFTYNSNF